MKILNLFNKHNSPQHSGIAPVSALTGKPVIHFAHANGMPSRVYQPLFDILADRFTVVFIPIMGADTEKYPVDNHWDKLVNQVLDSVQETCQAHQVSRVIGLGHSLGALCTLRAIYRQPKHFAQAVLLDPPLIYGYRSFIWHLAKIGHRFGFSQGVNKMSPAGVSRYRRDVWDNREQAYQSLRHKKFFKKFHERCFQGYIEHGLTERADGKFTLTYPKDREVAVFETNPSLYWLTPNQPPAVPVQWIVGEDSLFYYYQFPHKVKKRLNIPFITHQGGHMFPLEYPEEVAHQIISCIDSQS
ncbi:alpha/beta fold hydrolase [Psychrobacter sp. I-STPA6b]|uniref:alpha/beta fold hydrolase n=1 Tax=Psychrobacter sp. I-STPA6b TaxID=2585718 RepID=UPI001D0CB720|nr:alpha/beta hydrolase [Psychrobacter sp. I-STPA6b]